MRVLNVASCLSAAFALFIPVPRGHAQSDVRELIHRLESSHEKYQARMKWVQGTVTGQFIGFSNDENKVIDRVSSSWVVKYAKEYGTLQQKTTKETNKPGGSKKETEVYGNNPKYAFSLIGKDSKWMLREVVLDAGAPITGAKRRVDQEIAILISPHYSFLEMGSLASMIGSSEFKVESIDAGSDNLTKIKYQMKVENRPRFGVLRGEIVFDTRCWCIISHDTELLTTKGKKIREIMRYDVEASPDGWAKLKKAYEKAVFASGYRELTNDFQLDYDSTFDHAQLTLAAYGLPEPVGVVWPKPTKWWLWISLTALGCGVLACGLRKMKHRFQRPEMLAQ